MEILLIIPRYDLINKKSYNYLFPLGLAYISSAIKRAGYEVDCLNLNHLDGTMEDLVNKKLDSKKYDVVCSGHIGICYVIIEKIVNTAKNHPSKPMVIIGGLVITPEPKLIFESLRPDFGVIGEGEITIVELLDAIENNKDISEVDGIVYWKEGKYAFTKPREPIENLNSLPLPDFEGFGFEEQLDNMSYFWGLDIVSAIYSIFDYPRVYPLMCSRGCPFQCTFCYHCLGKKYRTRSVENVMKELREMVKKYKINIILIYDDLFSINRERILKFCREIKKLIDELPWKCKWVCQLSVRNIDRKMLKALKDSGCHSVIYGFESYSQKVLNSMKKPISPELIDRAIKLTLEFKMNVQGNFIFGDRAETKETAKETLDYWKKNCKGQMPLTFIQPYPGSEIFNHCIKKGLIKDKLDFIKKKMGGINWMNITDNMTDKEILELKKEILEAGRKYSKYITPIKFKKENKKSRYTFVFECPYCKEKSTYKNAEIHNRLYYIQRVYCRSCNMGFFIVSPLYKVTIDNYHEFDFLRRNYLYIRDNFLKKKNPEA